MGPASVGARAAVALALESAWEVYENTDTVINRYRAATIALGYYGDSVTNSVADILACLLGFVLARRLAWWWTVSWVVATEIVLAIAIRDNLTLNIIMLIRPIEAIKRWQLGALSGPASWTPSLDPAHRTLQPYRALLTSAQFTTFHQAPM